LIFDEEIFKALEKLANEPQTAEEMLALMQQCKERKVLHSTEDSHVVADLLMARIVAEINSLHILAESPFYQATEKLVEVYREGVKDIWWHA
jgi:hypothetical protein